MRRMGGLVGFLAVGAAVACGSTSDGGSGGGGVPLEDIPARFADASCKAVRACFGGAYDALLGGESCEGSAMAAVDDLIGDLKRRIDDGKLTYDGKAVDACLAAIEARGCGFTDEPEACEAVFEGAVAAGGDCGASEECVAEHYCKASGACPGKCAPLEGAGGRCTHDDDCRDGLACSEGGECQAPAASGDRCGGASDPECAPGLICVGADEEAQTSGNCRALDELLSGKEGDDCDPLSGPLCGAGLSCVFEGFDETTGTLLATCAKKLAAGADCNIGFPDPCPSDEFCAAETMMLSGTCEKRPGAGSPCASGPFSDAPDTCAPNTRCDGGSCRERQKIGGSCETDDVCLSEHCVGGKCAPAGGCG